MKISERSWHLRLMHYMWDRPYDGVKFVPRDLCSYFWTVFFSIAIPTGITVGLTYLAGWFVYENWRTLLGILAFASAVGTVFAIGLLGGRFIDQMVTNRTPKPEKKPNLLVEYVKAKKRRICPLIEVVP